MNISPKIREMEVIDDFVSMNQETQKKLREGRNRRLKGVSASGFGPKFSNLVKTPEFGLVQNLESEV